MSFETFRDAYIECALWSSTDNADESGGAPLDTNYSAENIADETFNAITEDCRDFYDAHADKFDDDSQAGHDFWLTRNRHGAGFWDRGLGPIGDELTAAAHVYGEVDLYVGDDGMLYT